MKAYQIFTYTRKITLTHRDPDVHTLRFSKWKIISNKNQIAKYITTHTSMRGMCEILKRFWYNPSYFTSVILSRLN